MKKFNWNRFYDELERGDPKKFPYWMFFFHELTEVIPKIVSGLMLGFLLWIVLACSFGIFASYFESHPDFIIRAACDSYYKTYEKK